MPAEWTAKKPKGPGWGPIATSRSNNFRHPRLQCANSYRVLGFVKFKPPGSKPNKADLLSYQPFFGSSLAHLRPLQHRKATVAAALLAQQWQRRLLGAQRQVGAGGGCGHQLWAHLQGHRHHRQSTWPKARLQLVAVLYFELDCVASCCAFLLVTLFGYLSIFCVFC